jgi:single-stranded-DNA-specific exonuclease
MSETKYPSAIATDHDRGAEAAITAAQAVVPQFHGPIALVPVHSTYAVHTFIADLWRSRLPDHIVVAANTGFQPGVVHFSARTATRTNVPDFLKENAPADAGDQFARGRDQAAGGALPFPAWNEFVAHLGFGSEVMVAPDAEPAGVAG